MQVPVPIAPVPKPLAKRKPDGTWAKGQSGFSGHRPIDAGRARRALNTDFIHELHRAFRRGGPKAIDKVMKQQPAVFIKMLTLLVPREMQIEHSNAVKQMSDQQIEDAIVAIEAMLAARDAGASAKVIEHQAAQLPAPAPRPVKRRRRKVVGIDMGRNEETPNSSTISGLGGG